MPKLKYQFLLLLIIVFFLPGLGQELILSGQGYDMHNELNWNAVATADRYQLWRKGENEAQFSMVASTRKFRYQDWTGREEEEEYDFQYYIEALSVPGNVLEISDTINTIVSPFTDEQFLDMTQEYTFRYFWEYAHPVSGMIRERLGSDDIVTTGGTGFGVMSIIVGIHRGYITRQQGVDRLLQLVSFLQFADRFHGAFPHWMNGMTGEVYPFSTFDNGGDLVETAFLMEGLLTAREYFNLDNEKENVLRDVITSLWEDVEWDFYSRNNSGVLYWHWSPEYQWQMNFPIRGYNEALIVYLLAIASPTHPMNATYWNSGWAGAGYVNGNTWYGYKLFVGPHFGGPLFFAHYSYMGFDPRNKKDAYANYFQQNINHTHINRSWCVDNPLHFQGYSEECWGLTASDDPWGYEAHAPGANTDNGTITPAAAIPSMPYTPTESITALRHFYRVYGEELWGEYGFYDAFNPSVDWFADSYLAIDQGPIINMIENYRSGLLWSAFMLNPEIAPALSAIGFEDDFVSTSNIPSNSIDWTVYPYASDGRITIDIQDDRNEYWKIKVVDALGRDIFYNKTNSFAESAHQILRIDIPYSGWAWIVLHDEHQAIDARPVWIK